MITEQSQVARDRIRAADPTCGRDHARNVPCQSCAALAHGQAQLRRALIEEVYRLEREAEQTQVL